LTPATLQSLLDTKRLVESLYESLKLTAESNLKFLYK
jgi:hypothetical protein